MKSISVFPFIPAAIAAGLLWCLAGGEEAPDAIPVTKSGDPDKAAADVREARLRSQLLHETIHGSLQVMHRDFFREGDRLRIPSSSMEDVFRELHRSWNVRVAWMAVNAKAMNIDHRPQGEFQQFAAKEIGGGKEMAEQVDGDTYRYAGAVSLGNECLKCHLPDRQNLEPRKAAVLITMPLRGAELGDGGGK